MSSSGSRTGVIVFVLVQAILYVSPLPSVFRIEPRLIFFGVVLGVATSKMLMLLQLVAGLLVVIGLLRCHRLAYLGYFAFSALHVASSLTTSLSAGAPIMKRVQLAQLFNEVMFQMHMFSVFVDLALSVGLCIWLYAYRECFRRAANQAL